MRRKNERASERGSERERERARERARERERALVCVCSLAGAIGGGARGIAMLAAGRMSHSVAHCATLTDAHTHGALSPR